MHQHFDHSSAIVSLDGMEFFADAADPHGEDARIGQTLCGFAFDAGRAMSLAWSNAQRWYQLWAKV